MIAKEEAILKAQTQFDEMIDLVRRAPATNSTIDQVERDLWGRLLAVGRAMLDGYVAGYDTGDLGPTVEHQGRPFRRLEEQGGRKNVG